jgi:hypothetical protein
MRAAGFDGLDGHARVERGGEFDGVESHGVFLGFRSGLLETLSTQLAIHERKINCS